MRYLGNKTKLLPFIDEIIIKHNIKGEIFADLFAGTATVGDYMKSKYQVISNDFMFYSFVFSKAKLMNNTIPKFTHFVSKYGITPFIWLNQKEYSPNENYFIFNNYTPQGKRQYFMEVNGMKIDGIRLDIEELYQEESIDEKEYYFLLASLLESVTKISNTSGTYEAFFKFWESRANREFVLEPLTMLESNIACDKNKVFIEDTNSLIRKISGDIAYIDTPYTVTQYSSAYHILETIARYDMPEIAGKTGRRKNGRMMSEYSRKKNAKNAFEDMFRQIDFNHILISYSNQSIVPIDELVDLAKKFAINNEVFIEKIPYREYKNLNSSKKNSNEKLHEVIIYFKKNRLNIKSPLNYSGSKDMILSSIYKELPYHVGTFVDAMGGAFNVGANVVALNTVVYNEVNYFIFKIIEMIIKENKRELIVSIERVIEDFKLNNKSKDEYINFRNYYNNSEKDPLHLFILHMFSFQNLIRFNKKHEFNTPVGNAGYNEGLKNRIMLFGAKTKNIRLLNGSFEELELDSFEPDTIFYFDPPYLITTAEYNDGKRGMRGWDVNLEVSLLAFLVKIDNKGFKFMLSNVIEHNNKVNHVLREWVEQHNYSVIDIGKTGSRYGRKEVLIKNY